MGAADVRADCNVRKARVASFCEESGPFVVSFAAV